MELNWSTFLLEMINFLVLVWLLKRFFYKPVLDVIARRRSRIEETLSDSKALQAQAEKLQEQYEGRLAASEQERRQARETLTQELEAERTAKMMELQNALEQEREKLRVVETRRQTDIMRKLEHAAVDQGARFASRLLQGAAGPDTEARLVELVTTELTQLPTDRIATLRIGCGKVPDSILVVSAFPLSNEQRQRLEQALVTIFGSESPLQFEQNSDLLAGLRITTGAWVLGANLQDELKGFAELTQYEKAVRKRKKPA